MWMMRLRLRRRPPLPLPLRNFQHDISRPSHGVFSSSWTPQRQQPSSTLSSLVDELESRPLNVTYDAISHTPSQNLNILLRDFLPVSFNPYTFTLSRDYPALTPGHHLVYFPPGVPDSALLPDGTDRLHAPDPSISPFTRRLWAGGSINFLKPLQPFTGEITALSKLRYVCVEGIRRVTLRGEKGKEKLLVDIERRYGRALTQIHSTKQGNWSEEFERQIINRIWERPFAAMVENRTLVFLRPEKKREENDLLIVDAPEQVVKPRHAPDFSITLTPPPSLLARFSALTHNAHRIHLDRVYCREVEGYRGLLVHGPLSLVLMLTVLRARLNANKRITELTYRNLAPLYAEEEMRVCVRRDREGEERKRKVSGYRERKKRGERGGKETGEREGLEGEDGEVMEGKDGEDLEGKGEEGEEGGGEDEEWKKQLKGMQMWEVWVEGRSGGYAVKGSATVWDQARPKEGEGSDDVSSGTED